MKQERDKDILLELQVAQTRQRILIGEDTYPIDIVETRNGKEKQIYYSLPNSVSQFEHTPEVSWYDLLPQSEWSKEVERRVTAMQKRSEAAKTGCLKHQELGVMSIQKNDTTPEKTVYLVDKHHLLSSDNINMYSRCDDETFITEAKRQGWAIPLFEYESRVNFSGFSTASKYIRFR